MRPSLRHPHPPAALHLEDTHGTDLLLAVAAFALGVVGLLLVAVDAPRAGMWCGVVGVLAGLWGQMVSRTRSERFADVVGLVAAAVAFALGAAQGGLVFSG
ncbi:MAG: hypothetical protein WCD35_03155 [Mycobacteriales bacterium]